MWLNVFMTLIILGCKDKILLVESANKQ